MRRSAQPQSAVQATHPSPRHSALAAAATAAGGVEAGASSVRAWLEANRLSEYYDNFINEGWETLEDVAGMEQNDLKDCGMIKGGHRKRALKAIGILQVEEGSR